MATGARRSGSRAKPSAPPSSDPTQSDRSLSSVLNGALRAREHGQPALSNGRHF